MRLLLQCNHYYNGYNNSFRKKKSIGFVNVKKYAMWRKRKWCSGFFEKNPWLKISRYIKDAKKGM